MKLTDFLGKQYGPGDLVIYGAMSGRSVNVVVGRVVDIYMVYHCPDSYRWKRVPLTDSGETDIGAIPKQTYGVHAGEPREHHTKVKVQPLRGARWTQHHGRKRWIDTRTGKGINPDAGKGLPHVLKESHYVRANGEEYDYAGERRRWEAAQTGRPTRRSFEYYDFRSSYHINYGTPGEPPRFPRHESEEAKVQLWYVPRSYQPWVQEVSNGPGPVTLDIIDNIVKWEGELPDEVPDEVP